MAFRVLWLFGMVLWAGLASAHPVGAQGEATELLCAMRTGGTTATLRATAGDDPLGPSTVEVGESFEVRAIALREAPGAETVGRVVVTVLGRTGGDDRIVLSQGRWTAGRPATIAYGDRWRPALSGWQRAYLPGLGRELAWGCALVQPGATPEGWDLADATGDSGFIVQPSPRVTRAGTGAAAVRVAWMGDVMLADGPGRVIARGGDPFAAVMGAMKGADLRIANLECVIASGGTKVDKPWTFRAHPRALDVLRRHVDLVSLANNHSGDFGADAFTEMLGRLTRAGVAHVGGGIDLRSAHRPVILERQGLRIAFLAYNEMFPRRFEAGPERPGIAWADEEQIVADLAAARAQADVVIPFVHWGEEHSETAHARQRALARLMVRAGADAVVGSHPHVRQDTEIIDGKPVIYSLGNFVFDGFKDADNNTGSILWMTITAQGVRDWHLQEVHIDAAGRPHPQALSHARNVQP